MPMFASTPSAPETLTMLSFAAAACGPAIFKPSARSVSVCAEPFAVAVRMSDTSAILELSMPNTRMLLAAISAASPSSVPVARERFRTAGIAASISLALNPMRPMAVMPSATCFAVKLVSRPSFSATSVSRWNSFSVAPVTALTIRIWSSKSENVLVANVNGAAAMAAAITMPFPAVVSDVPKFFSFAWADLRPRSSLVWSSMISTNARPAFTLPLAPANRNHLLVTGSAYKFSLSAYFSLKIMQNAVMV